METSVTAHRQRYLFIDLFRTGIILLMLEGHIARSLLPQESQQSTWFMIHEFIHGLSAPAFLFGAGLTFVISTRKRWEEYHHWDRPLAGRLGRVTLVLLLGLALHLPYFSMQKIITQGTTADYLQLFQADVLACIGIGLLALHAFLFFFKTEQRFYILVSVTGLVVCFLTPYVWDTDFLRYLPIPIAQLFNSQHGSPFPLFPYIGFLFAGTIVSWEYISAVQEHREQRLVRSLLMIGAGFIALGLILDAIPFQIYPTYNFWYTSPNYFLIRVGSLILLMCFFLYLETIWKKPHPVTTVIGRESLFVYVLHLPLIYGSVINPGWSLNNITGSDPGPAGIIGTFIGFTIAMLAVAQTWNWLKEKENYLYWLVKFGGAAIFLHYFFMKPF